MNRHLDDVRPRLDDQTLLAIAEGIARSDVRALLPEAELRRWALVVRTEVYDAWVIAWPARSGLAMHDHDGSAAAVAVVEGQLQERYCDALVDAGVGTRSLSAGDSVVLPPDHVHEVLNVGLIEAVSVHVYSPPLDDVAFRIDPELDLREISETVAGLVALSDA